MSTNPSDAPLASAIKPARQTNRIAEGRERREFMARVAQAAALLVVRSGKEAEDTGNEPYWYYNVYLFTVGVSATALSLFEGRKSAAIEMVDLTWGTPLLAEALEFEVVRDPDPRIAFQSSSLARELEDRLVSYFGSWPAGRVLEVS